MIIFRINRVVYSNLVQKCLWKDTFIQTQKRQTCSQPTFPFLAYFNQSFPERAVHNVKQNRQSYRSWSSPSPFSVNRRKLDLQNVSISSTAAANFISIPGSTPPVKKKEYSERRILGYSMDQMFDVVADVEKYQEFLPWCESSIIKTRRKGHLVADLVVGISPVIESYTSSVSMIKPHMIKAESTQGRLFNHLINLWKFSPGLKGKPQTCIVDFYVSFEFRSALTSKVANVFFNEVVRAMVIAFYKEAQKRYGPESIPSRKISIISGKAT